MTAANAAFTGPRFYDELVVPVTFGPFAAELVRRVPGFGQGRELELACGTGAVTRLLREHLPSGAALVATDLSPTMLEYARARVPGEGASGMASRTTGTAWRWPR